LRAFTFGHVRQLDALLGRALERAWKAGATRADTREALHIRLGEGEHRRSGPKHHVAANLLLARAAGSSGRTLTALGARPAAGAGPRA
jgi:hypothetical protein